MRIGFLDSMIRWYDNLREVRRIHNTKYEWTAHQTQGGGVYKTPPLTRREAVDYVASKGASQVIFIDDSYHFIFYK